MRAFVLDGPRSYAIGEVDPPTVGPGQVVVDIELVGVCGTDIEFFTGEMQYLHEGLASYPIRLGHEWCGQVSAVGAGVDPALVGTRTTGDTMLGCGACYRCVSGRHHVCEFRFEVGVRGGWPGALAEQLVVPSTSLHALPESVDAVAGAMVEPGGNALRSVWAADLGPRDRVLIIGPGTIGLLTAKFAAAAGAEVHIVGRPGRSADFARTLGFEGVWSEDDLPQLAFDAVIDASNSPTVPALALELVEPGKRLVYVGLAGSPSLLDSRTLALKDVTAVGILGASLGLDETIRQYASGAVDPRDLVSAIVGLDELGPVLAGERPPHFGPGSKVLVDPRR